jgi:hypothetical protein
MSSRKHLAWLVSTLWRHNGPRFWQGGRLSVRTDSIVDRLEVADGEARGLSYVERETSERRRIAARTAVMAASTLQTTRILLNSGLGEGLPALGRYLFDHWYVRKVVNCTLTKPLSRLPTPFAGRGYLKPAAGGPYAFKVTSKNNEIWFTTMGEVRPRQECRVSLGAGRDVSRARHVPHGQRPVR